MDFNSYSCVQVYFLFFFYFDILIAMHARMFIRYDVAFNISFQWYHVFGLVLPTYKHLMCEQ